VGKLWRYRYQATIAVARTNSNTNTMYRSILLFVSTLLPVIINAQQLQDGPLVPFTSSLPSCASQCGPLSDVQGKCVASNTVDSSCFCADSRLTPFLQGTSGVSSVCGAASCTSITDLQTIESWYESYCNIKSTTGTTTSSSSSSTATSSSNSSSSSNSGKPAGWYVHPLLKLCTCSY
jgi:hypothetical protein